jgi:hypothetical protein
MFLFIIKFAELLIIHRFTVESRTGAVVNSPRFLSLLIKPDVRSYRIRLSD